MSSEPTASDPGRSRRIERALAEYLLAADAGQAPDPAAWLDRYPDLQPELGQLLAMEEGLGRMAAPVRPERRSPLASDQAPAAPPVAPDSTRDDPFRTEARPTGQAGVTVTVTRGSSRGGAPAAPVGATGDGPDPDDARPDGTRVRYFGDYELIKVLGRGGMGVVYKARQISLNRPVALKMLKSEVLATDDERRRFQNEAEAVATLDPRTSCPCSRWASMGAGTTSA
jgi:hypothetical protein